MLEALDRTIELPLDTATKRALIETELRKDAGRADREIARIVGCDHKTVGAVRAKLSPPISPDAQTPTERRHMLIEGCKEFDRHFPPGPSDVATAEEAVDNAIAKGIVSLAPVKIPPPPGTIDKPKYDPFDPKEGDMVIPHQPAIAVFENTSGAVVIIQAACDGQDEDPIILVRPEHVEKLIARLRKVAAEASA